MEPLKSVGRFLRGDENRDAVHFALAPVKAAEKLKPGQHISVADGKALSGGDHIGIVDPFLRRDVEPDEFVWIFLYPNTITSLRHEWVHPAFAPSEAPDELRLAFEFVAQTCGKTYSALMEDMQSYNWSLEHSDWGNYIIDNSERYKNVEEDAWKKAWAHYERVTGEKPRDKYLSGPYTCSC